MSRSLAASQRQTHVPARGALGPHSQAGYCNFMEVAAWTAVRGATSPQLRRRPRSGPHDDARRRARPARPRPVHSRARDADTPSPPWVAVGVRTVTVIDKTTCDPRNVHRLGRSRVCQVTRGDRPDVPHRSLRRVAGEPDGRRPADLHFFGEDTHPTAPRGRRFREPGYDLGMGRQATGDRSWTGRPGAQPSRCPRVDNRKPLTPDKLANRPVRPLTCAKGPVPTHTCHDEDEEVI